MEDRTLRDAISEGCMWCGGNGQLETFTVDGEVDECTECVCVLNDRLARLLSEGAIEAAEDAYGREFARLWNDYGESGALTTGDIKRAAITAALSAVVDYLQNPETTS